MKKIEYFIFAICIAILGTIAITPMANAGPIGGTGTPYCLPTAPTVIVGTYIGAYVVSIVGSPITSIEEVDSYGKYYVTIFGYTNGVLTSTSCPLQYSTQQ
jgi:hypothetical protein